MSPQVIAPPPVLTDSHGLRWVFAGMTDLGPAYLPQQTPLPMIAPEPAAVETPWYEVKGYVTGEGE